MSVVNLNIQSTAFLTRVLWGLLTIVFVCPQITQAQVLSAKNNSEPTDELQRLPSDRKIAQQLQELGRTIQTGNAGKIRDALKLLRAADPSLMVPDGSKTFRPLHRDLIERIQSFPAELQAELLNEPGASSRLLQAAYQDNGPTGLIIFLHRYAGSRESLKAHLMLAAIHRDRGHRQGTLYWLDPVLHASVPADLHDSAIAMRDEVNAAANITQNADSDQDSESCSTRSGMTLSTEIMAHIPSPLGKGEKVAEGRMRGAAEIQHDEPIDARLFMPPHPSPPPPWKACEVGKSIAGGEGTFARSATAFVLTARSQEPTAAVESNAEAANDTTSASEAISKLIKSGPAWQQKLYLNSAERHASQDFVRLLAAEGDQQAIPWIAGEPVVDSNAIYVRASGGLLAYDKITGQLRWTRPLDRQATRRTVPGRMPLPNGDERSSDDLDRLQKSREILSLHRDAIPAHMTSDATRLFAISDSNEPGAAIPEFNQPFGGMLSSRSDLTSHPPQELVAIDKVTGRRLWSIGGAPLEERFGNELSRAWFAGAPTVSGGLLFGIIEHDDAHWLVCLRSETGEVVWKQILAYPEVNIFQDPVRQLISSRPLVKDGLIWASTADGWLMAVDALTHSVLWSRNMVSKSPDSTQRLMLRRGIIQTQQLDSIGETWRPADMQLLQDALLVTNNGNHQLLMINPLTGGIRRRVPKDGATVILAADDESIVVAGPKEIQRLSLENFKVVWKTKLNSTGVVAIGPGVRLDDSLLIQLSDGSIQVIRYADGKLTENFAAIRPAFSAGGLKSLPDGLVSYGLDHVCVFSANGNATQMQTEPLEQARFLFETAQFEEAEKILLELQPAADQIDLVNRLLFRIAAIRTLNETDQQDVHLQTAARYASTARDRAVVLCLTLETQPDIASDQVVEFLKSPQTVLNIELPQIALLKEMLIRPVVDSSIVNPDMTLTTSARVTRPLRHQMLQILQQHLADNTVSDFASWTSALEEISDTDVLSIEQNSEILRDELMRRADLAVLEDKLTETAWHLLLQARRCEDKRRLAAEDSDDAAKNETPSDSDREFDTRHSSLVDRFINQLAIAASQKDHPLRPHHAAVNLLSIVKSELFPDAADDPPPTPREVLAQQWSQWQDATDSAVPVHPVEGSMMPQSNESKLTLRYLEDPFLSAWRWSTFRETSVLAIRSLLQPDEPMCTIEGGMFDAISLGSAGSVVRFGSVVLVQNSMGLSAVSIIDQRVLWSRRIPNQSSRVIWQLIAQMHLFNQFSTTMPAWLEIYGRDLRISGGHNRWICVQTPTGVEMIDLLTGQNLWSLQNPPESRSVFATDSCVFVRKTSNSTSANDDPAVTCLSQAAGVEQNLAISQDVLRSTIMSTGDELVVWDDSVRSGGSILLNWTNVKTGKVRKSQELKDMLKCQFMDIRTLAAVTEEGAIEIIDLVTADKKVVELAVPDESDADNEMKKDDYSKSIIMADPANYYVFALPGVQAGQVQIMLGSMGDLYPIGKELRAIDRVTGKTRWTLTNDDNTNALFDVTGDPVLLLVNFSTRKKPANAPGRLVIPGLGVPNHNQSLVTAYSRISGEKLFQHNVMTRFPSMNLEFKVTPQKHLDLRAFGSRIRFVPQE